ncbi:hypothetical protein HN51_021050 [Arachis hypogaea]
MMFVVAGSWHGIQMLQQFAGINCTPQILQETGVETLKDIGISSKSTSFLISAVTTLLILPGIALSMRLIDISGRRFLNMQATTTRCDSCVDSLGYAFVSGALRWPMDQFQTYSALRFFQQGCAASASYMRSSVMDWKHNCHIHTACDAQLNRTRRFLWHICCCLLQLLDICVPGGSRNKGHASAKNL